MDFFAGAGKIFAPKHDNGVNERRSGPKRRRVAGITQRFKILTLQASCDEQVFLYENAAVVAGTSRDKP